MKKVIVKRAGHAEDFDERKVYASVFASLIAVRVSPQEAELVSEKVTSHVKAWLATKLEVTSRDILHQAAKALHQLNDDAAFLYEHHRNVS